MWHLKLDEMMMPLTLYTKFDCATVTQQVITVMVMGYVT